ncbi:MAG: phage minor capsid protein [Fusicatenibacter sp.]|nr:phage minor capsid protein [Fusicatenibacter sp.]
MMISRSEKQKAAEPVTQSYMDMEALIMQNIIRHVKDYGQLIDSDDWLLQKLAELGKLNKENIAIIAKAAWLSREAVEKMCYDVADTVMERIEPGLNELERVGVVEGAVPARKSRNVQNAVKAVHRQAWDSLNTCNTTMLYMARDAYKSLVQKTATRAKEIANKQEFLDTLGKHATAEIVGAESRQQAIRSVIKEFNEKGIPAFVDKAGRQWTPEAYVSMTLRATAGNVSTEAMMARMNDRGLSLIQMSSHAGARPKCAKDQGKIFDRNNGKGYVEDINGKKIPFYPLKSSSYGEPDGILGINCGHHGVPFIPGISTERYFPTEDFEENDRLYKQMQTQRGLERDVRKQKRLCMLYDEAGDENAFEEAAVSLKSKEAQLADYVGKNDLIRRKDREQVVGFDRRISAGAVGAANKHFKKWAKSIGAEAGPKGLAGYYDLKYNDSKESRLYKGYVSAVENSRISPMIGYDQFKKADAEITDNLDGLTTASGVVVKGHTAHFVDRLIGTHVELTETDNKELKKRLNHASVSMNEAKQAITEGTAGEIVTDNKGRRSQRFTGDKCIVTFNPDTQELIQTNRKR